ncbi:HNH endonuclease [Candidatus Saccharibacteria bacterium]|nr:HNH endonuclease [Candidatus Saccharibacteria bacterium]
MEKRRRTWKEHYHKYGSKYRERAVERNRKLKIKNRKLLLEYLKDKSCEVCGIDDPRVLEFDHINPVTKSFTIARGISSLLLSWEKILTEIEKCQILCANCHKIKTAQEQSWYRNI